MGNKPSNQSKLSLWIRLPLRFLGKLRNLYVQCMYGCANLAGQGDVVALPPAYYSSLSSFRTSSSSDVDDLQELIRANSESKLIDRVGSKIEIGSNSDLVNKVQRRRKSCDMIETIDEDKSMWDVLKVRTDLKRVRG